MCGIVGFWGGNPEEAVLQNMAEAIAHRGPDDGGRWVDADQAIALSQQRLSIVDLSPAGHQPMISSCGRYVLIFNGEIYNFRNIRQKLDQEAHRNWQGHSDTEVLLEAISSWGVEQALKHSVGMFALALWDKKDATLTLTRDRMGEKPLYFGKLDEVLVFSSELKALKRHPNFKAQINHDALTLMMRHMYIPAPFTIYSGIHKILPGTYYVFSKERPEPTVKKYWDIFNVFSEGSKNPFQGSPDEAVNALEELLKQSIKDQMIADVPLGAFLSGGVDSSTIVALMQSINTGPVKTFSIGFDVAAYNEADHAKSVAAHLGTDHTEFYVSEKQAQDVIPLLPDIYCEPFADASQIPTYLVAKLARNDVTVSLSGDGGDELFSGYRRYQLGQNLWQRFNKIPLPLRRLASYCATLPSPNGWDGLAAPLLCMLPQHKRPQLIGEKIHKAAGLLNFNNSDELYSHVVSHWKNPSDIVLNSREPQGPLTGLLPVPENLSAIERMMYKDTISYLPDDILTKVDRAAMAVSLESRVPLLDHRIIEFAARLPLSIKRHNNTAKWPLRQVLYRHVPKTLIERPKAGFSVPIDAWLRGALQDFAEDLLDENKLRQQGIFNPAPIRKAWQDHLSGKRNMQYHLWGVLMFQAWHEKQKAYN